MKKEGELSGPYFSDTHFEAEIQIEDAVLQRMIEHAEADFPNECCGFVLGKEGVPRALTHMRAVPNDQAGDQRRRFLISPLDYMKAEKYAIEQGLDLLGVYHSHPNHPAIASIHDHKQAAPFFSYLILSIQDGKFDHIRSWRLDDDGLFSEELLSNKQDQTQTQ
ncbi:M67 family metallopeptidase [Pontibacter sp. G13]|uniref:M67 family metallopeptidase n=1 Tax=Pontibacter sp. G13 TaxID=3074898 RepID=UPI002889CEB6|nr:M67 family metallopeptidase [Pontibacter sp. G13]WNJ18826.1 M67 family metallopeptidase [Pontibacter sp. G13]